MPAIAELQQLIALIAASACAVIVLFIASADALETVDPPDPRLNRMTSAADPELETVYFDFDSASFNQAARPTCATRARPEPANAG